MSPTPIPPSVVHVVLQYIAPPSQLTHPIPPHLLSKSLLQRHHFLQLSPDDPQEYLCWPASPDRQKRAIELLEDLPSLLHDDEPVDLPVRYTADEEHAYAHVDLSYGASDGIRLVFEWDGSDGWKFHDASMMPFPPDSHSILQEIPVFQPSNLKGQLAAKTAHYGLENLREEDDDYWNAYGSQDDGASFEAEPTLPVKNTDAGTEDAYWARYASVHGTADSTQPSPPPQAKRILHPMHDNSDTGSHSPNALPVPVRPGSCSMHDNVLPIPPSVMPRPSLHSKWDPASPRALAQLLAAVPPRDDLSPIIISIPEEIDYFQSDSPTVGGSTGSEDSDILVTAVVPNKHKSSHSNISLDHIFETMWEDSKKMSGTRPRISIPDQSGHDGETNPDDVDGEMEALQDGIRGIWKLWQVARRRRSAVSPLLLGNTDKEIFLNVVRDAIGSV